MVTGPVRYGRKAVMYSMACSPRSVKDVVTGGMGLLSSGSWTQVISDLSKSLPSGPTAQLSDDMVS